MFVLIDDFLGPPLFARKAEFARGSPVQGRCGKHIHRAVGGPQIMFGEESVLAYRQECVRVGPREAFSLD